MIFWGQCWPCPPHSILKPTDWCNGQTESWRICCGIMLTQCKMIGMNSLQWWDLHIIALGKNLFRIFPLSRIMINNPGHQLVGTIGFKSLLHVVLSSIWYMWLVWPRNILLLCNNDKNLCWQTSTRGLVRSGPTSVSKYYHHSVEGPRSSKVFAKVDWPISDSSNDRGCSIPHVTARYI